MKQETILMMYRVYKTDINQLKKYPWKKRLGTFSLKWYFTSVKILYSGKVQNFKKHQPNAFITCISSGGKIPQVIYIIYGGL